METHRPLDGKHQSGPFVGQSQADEYYDDLQRQHPGEYMPREGGTGYPLYQRRQERDATTAPIKVVKRFVRTGSQARPSQGMLPVSPRIHGDFNNRNME